MKILILSFYYQPDLCAGSFRCTALVNELIKVIGIDDEVDVITTMPHRYSSFDLNALELEQHQRVNIRRIKLVPHHSNLVHQVKGFLHFAKVARKLTKNKDYDLVFATSSRLMTAALGAWVSRKKNTKLYLDIRDIFVDTFKDVFTSKITHPLKPILALLERWTFKRANRINLVSKGFYPYFVERSLEQKLRCFTNGVDQKFVINRFDANVEDVSCKRRTVLYAGNIGEGQGLHRIIPELAKHFVGILDFKVIGDGGRQQVLAAKIQELGCNNVELLPPVSRELLVQEYQKADILFIHLNDHEAFYKVLPSKLFEYAATGKPIWAGVSGYAAKFIRSEITTNVAIFEPCNVAQAISVFPAIGHGVVARDSFVGKFNGSTILHSMASDILNLVTVDN